jgi:F-type H+-transporting ATPase subunit gamma
VAVVLESVMPHLLSMQLYHIVLEANASEHSARRVAMKTASDNAEGLSQELTLIYNKARQANITTELIEITSTQQAL